MKDIDRRDRFNAFRLVGYQAAMVVIFVFLGLLVQKQIAISILIGGAIGVAGSAWLTYTAFRPSATRPAKAILASFYMGEIGKFLIVMILFIVAFKQVALLRESRNAMIMFLAFIGSQMAAVFAYIKKQ